MTLSVALRWRLVFAVLSAMGMAIIYGLKVNLSVAIVAMLNHTALEEHAAAEAAHGAHGDHHAEDDQEGEHPLTCFNITKGGGSGNEVKILTFPCLLLSCTLTTPLEFPIHLCF